MGDKSSIEWTEATWNPVTGCDRVSEGCDHCYAATLAKRLKAMGNPRYQVDGDPKTSGPGFGVTLHEDMLDLPLRWKRPRVVFVNSMSDLFHPDVPDEFIANVFEIMGSASQHTFQVLTKRPGRMASLLQRWTRGEDWYRRSDGILDTASLPLDADPKLHEEYGTAWPLPNVWLGTSVENQKWADVRIPKLLETPAAVRFLSCEPLLGPIDLHPYLIRGARHGAEPRGLIHWVIAGGESGPKARPMDPRWVIELRDQCTYLGSSAFFFKQWGGHTPKAGGRELDGRTWDEMPEAVLV